MPEDTATAAPVAEPRKRSANNQRIAAYITEAARFLQIAKTDSEIRPLIEARGIDDAEIALGENLVQAATDAWGLRSEGMGEEDAAVAGTAAGLKAARDAYIQFREIGRANFPEKADRTALGLGGDIAEGFNSFITQATASYTVGKEPAYTAKLTKRGYGPDQLNALIAELEELTNAEAAQTQAEGAAIGDTQTRDTAYADLKTFMAEFKGTVKGALRGHHDLLAKLGV